MKKVVSLTAEEGGPGKYQFYIAYKNRGRKGRESGTENVFHLLDGWVTPSPVFRNLVGGLLNLVLALSPDRQVGQHQPQNEPTHTLSKHTHIWKWPSTEFGHKSIQADCCTHTHTRPRCMKHSHQTCCEIFTWALQRLAAGDALERMFYFDNVTGIRCLALY